MKKYKFRKYKKNYPKLYCKEENKLNKVLSGAKIEHIGSTAVTDVGGKGIIDIIISVPKNEIKEIKEKLIKQGYGFKSKAGEKNRLFFEKDYGTLKKRRVHLQLTSNNSNIWKKSIKFRDLLRKNKKIRGEYSLIKQDAVKHGKQGAEYRAHKKEFITKTLKQK